LNTSYIYLLIFTDRSTTRIYTLSLHDALPIYGQLRKPLDDIMPAAGRHRSPSPSDHAPTARGGEGYRGVRCSGIRRPEGGDRQDGGTRRRGVGLRRSPGRAVEETRTSDSICRTARGRGPQEY